MTLYRIALALLLFILVASCALTSKLSYSEKEKLLIKHLEDWSVFSADGIVTANYQNFEFRKNINIKKSNEQIKLVVFDSGVFGMSPEPFIKVTIDSLVQIETQGSETAETKDLSEFPGFEYLLRPQKFMQHSRAIINKGIIHFPDLEVSFNNEMKLSEIKSLSNNLTLEFYYNNTIQIIQITQNHKQLIKIEIDKFSNRQD